MASSEATLRLLLVGVDKGASKLFRNVGDETEGAAGKTSKFKAAAIAGMAAAGAAVVAFGKKSVDAYQDAAKESSMLARVTGMTVKESSRLRFAAEESGVEFNTLSTSTRIFSKNLAAATGSTSKMADLTKQLGFSVKDAHGNLLPMSELLPKVADRFKSMPDGPQKTAMAMKLFGKSGADMVKILNKGSEGLAELGKESDKTGNTLSNVDGYKKTLQAQREFHAATQGLQVQLGAALYPVLTVVATYLAAHVGPAISHVTDFVHQHADVISRVAPLLAILVAAFVSVVGILKVYRAIQAGVNMVMEANPIMLVVTALALLAVGLVYAYKHSETFRDIVNGAFHVVADAIGFVKDHWRLLIELILGPFGAAIVFAVDHFHAIESTARTVFKFIVNAFLDVVGALIDGAAKAFGWVPGIGPKLKAAADDFDHFKDRVNAALDGIHSEKDIHLNVTTKQSVEVSSINKPRVPHSATGARYLAGGAQWVGERGPEIAWFPRGTAITPAAESARMAGRGSAPDGILGSQPLVLQLDSRNVWTGLLQLKRTNGNLELGLA